MKRIFILLLILSGILTACGMKKNITNTNAPEDEWGLTLSAENVTPTGLTIKFSQSDGKHYVEFTTGSQYEIEQELNGVWEKVKTNVDNPVWNDIAYIIKSGGITDHKINWEFLYGELLEGSYRLSKEIYAFTENSGYETKTFYVYFDIK